MTWIRLVLLLSLALPVASRAQSLAQYHFSPLLLNPAWAGASSHLSLAAQHRSQRVQALDVQRTAVTLMSPLRWKEQKRVGLGLHFLNDRAEDISRFTTQEVGITLAYHHPLAKKHYLSVGTQAHYQQGTLGVGNATTGSQWTAHRGFDPQQGIGEVFGDLRQHAHHWSAGGLWYQERRPGQFHHYVGVSAQQLNRAALWWTDQTAASSVRYTAQAGWQAFRRNQISATPEVLWRQEAGQQYFNVGTRLSYHFQNDNPFDPLGDGAVSLLTRHTVGESTVMGVQLSQPHFEAGFSYDWGASSSLDPGFQATEYGVVLRRSIFRAKKKVVPTVSAPQQRTFGTQPDQPKRPPVSATIDTSNPTTLAVDSVRSPEVVTVEHRQAFNFDFNDTGLNEGTRRYLEDVVTLLQQNPHLHVRVVGHTDDVGTPAANQVVSKKRANAVRDFLLEQGVAADRIQTAGRGNTEPLVRSRDEAARAKNRRIEIELYAP